MKKLLVLALTLVVGDGLAKTRTFCGLFVLTTKLTRYRV